MKNVSSVFSIVSLLLALVFTFSCSSDDNNNDTYPSSSSVTSISGLPKQLYIEDEEYNGNGDIVFVFYEFYNGEKWIYSPELVPAGKIQNGLIELDLPKNVDSIRLMKPGIDFSECEKDGIDCEDNVSYPENMALVGGYDHLQAIIPDKGRCKLHLYADIDEYTSEGAGFLYASMPGKITGTAKYYAKETYDMNLSEGFNIIYLTASDKLGSYEYLWSTDPKIITGTLKWQLDCMEGDDI